MKNGLSLIAWALFFALSPPCYAVEMLSCVQVVSTDKAHPTVNPKCHADLAISGGRVLSRVVVPAADKPITFKGCRETDDKGNFHRWFGTVCTQMTSLDGSPFSMDVYFYGAYAGLSRPLTPKDSMWNVLKDASHKAGIPMPQRTFVVYAGKSPVFEFFCSNNPRLALPSAHPDSFDKGLKVLLEGGTLPPDVLTPKPNAPPIREFFKNWPDGSSHQQPSNHSNDVPASSI